MVSTSVAIVASLFLSYISIVQSELACCEQYNIPGAKVIITEEHVDFYNEPVMRESIIQTANHGVFDVKILPGPKRVEIENFINEQEIATTVELFDSFNEQEYDIVYPGFDNVRGPQQFYPTKALYRTPLYETGEMTPKKIEELYNYNIRREKLNKFYFLLLDRTIDAAQTYFNESHLVLKDSFLVRRYQPGNKQPVQYPGCNITNWNHHPHVDRCTLTLDDVNGRTCRPYSLLPVEYSCMIYLNDVDGGELVLLNMPQGKDALLKTMEERVHEMNGSGDGGTESNNFRRHLRNNNNSSSNAIEMTKFATESYVPIYERPNGASKDDLKILKKRKLADIKLTKFDIGGEDLRPIFKPVTTQWVSSKKGNLLCFKSTPENLHGVNEVRNGVRKNISFFLATKQLYDQWAKTGRTLRDEREKQQQQPQQQQQQQKAAGSNGRSKATTSSSSSSKKNTVKKSEHKNHAHI